MNWRLALEVRRRLTLNGHKTRGNWRKSTLTRYVLLSMFFAMLFIGDSEKIRLSWMLLPQKARIGIRVIAWVRVCANVRVRVVATKIARGWSSHR